MDGAYKWSRQRLGPDLIPDIPPEFPAREVPVDTAQTQIAVAVKELPTACLSSHHGKATLISGAAGVGKTRQVIDQLRKPVRVNATYAWYRAQQTVEGVVSKVWKTRRVETFLDWDATHEPGAERSLLWGLEKQSSHAQSITRLEQRPLRVHWYAPTLELCEETYTRLTADKDETGESIRPVTAAVLRGRGYVHAQDDDGLTASTCANATSWPTNCADTASKPRAQLSAYNAARVTKVWSSARTSRDVRTSTSLRRRSRTKSKSLSGATASLASPTSIAESYAASLGRRDPYRPPWTPDTVIIDESPLPYMLKSKRMPIDKFSNINPGLQAVVRHLQDGKDLHTLGEEVLEHLYQLHPDNIDPVRIASPDMSDEEIAQAIRMAPAPPSIDWDAVYPIVHAIENGLPCNSVWLERPWSDGSQYVRCSALKRPSYPAKTNYLLLVATLDAELLRPIWPTAKLVEVHPEQNIIVTQVATASFSHSSLLVDAEGEAAGNPHVVKELNDLVAVVRQQFSKPVGVICPKALEPAIEADLTAHFGALRGLDGFKHMGVLMVVGRTLPPALDVESTARALYPHVELDLPGAYKWGALGWRLRGGGAQFGVNDLVHPDPLVHRVLRSVREAEVVQAVGRIRGVHRTDPAHVLILGSLPVDVTVDYLVENPRELYADGILELVHKCGGTMPLSVADLRKRLGDEIGKEDAIEDRIRRQKDRGSVSEYLKFPALARVSRGATADSVERLVYISTKQSTESAVDAARQGVPGF